MNNYIFKVLDGGETLITKFGRANIWGDTYKITSKTEGNNRKSLDKLIYEDFHKVTVLKNIHINHKDGNKLNNDIDNLELLSKSDYWAKNISGKNHFSYGKKVTKETRLKISKANQGKNKVNWTSEMKENLSKRKTSTGIYRVSKYMAKKKRRWKYTCQENGKQTSMSSIDILKLKEKVKNKNLEWAIVDEKKAGAIAVECGLSLSDLL